MAWRHHRIWIVALLILSGLALAWLIWKTPVAPPADTAIVATSTDLTGRAIFLSGEYGFMVSYPETAQVEDTFLPTYHLGTAWRAGADAASVGEPIVALVAYSTQSDHSYPRYYHAIVRIGASRDAKEVGACEKVSPDRGETALPDQTFGDATWRVFSFGDAGMQQYVKGVSYRTVHEGACIAIEKIAAGSSYRDDPDSPDDIADSVLEERYAGLDRIIETFQFVRPE